MDDKDFRIGSFEIYLPHGYLKSALWAFKICQPYKISCFLLLGTSLSVPHHNDRKHFRRLPWNWKVIAVVWRPVVLYDPQSSMSQTQLASSIRCESYTIPQTRAFQGTLTHKAPFSTSVHCVPATTDRHCFKRSQLLTVWKSVLGAFINSSGPVARRLDVKLSDSGEGDPKQLDLDVRYVSGIYKQRLSVACKRWNARSRCVLYAPSISSCINSDSQRR